MQKGKLLKLTKANIPQQDGQKKILALPILKVQLNKLKKLAKNQDLKKNPKKYQNA